MTVDNVLINFTASINDTDQLRFNFKNAAVGSIVVNNITFGYDKGQNMTLITYFLNDIISQEYDALNTYLYNKTITIPLNLFWMFTLANPELTYHDGYIEAGLSATFHPLANFKAYEPSPIPDITMSNEIMIERIDQYDNHTCERLGPFWKSYSNYFSNEA